MRGTEYCVIFGKGGMAITIIRTPAYIRTGRAFLNWSRPIAAMDSKKSTDMPIISGLRKSRLCSSITLMNGVHHLEGTLASIRSLSNICAMKRSGFVNSPERYGRKNTPAVIRCNPAGSSLLSMRDRINAAAANASPRGCANAARPASAPDRMYMRRS